VAWSVTLYSDRVEAEILALAPGLLARFIRYAERMEIFGPDLGMPRTRAMGGGMFELRIKPRRELRGCSSARQLTVASSFFTNS
jgi:hypothetical protein